MPDSSAVNINSDELFEEFDSQNRLGLYYDLLLVENKRINLVSRETSIDGLKKLAAESLAPFCQNTGLSALLASKGKNCYLDIGSGGGFPAIPIAIAGSFESSILIERRQKKAAALTRIAVALHLPVSSDPRSFEETSFDNKFDLITMRLVRLDDDFLKAVIRLLTPTGKFLYYSDYSTPKTENMLITSERYTIDNKEDQLTCTIFSVS